jgi:ubiquitin-protein ligase
MATDNSDGKVCLSLLGTWPGSPEEQWRPNQSTIMQILISIQSMLLCSRPYFNEPGSGEPGDTYASQVYNKEVRLQTVRVGICDWMTPAHSQSIWKVSSHVGRIELTIRT